MVRYLCGPIRQGIRDIFYFLCKASQCKVQQNFAKLEMFHFYYDTDSRACEWFHIQIPSFFIYQTDIPLFKEIYVYLFYDVYVYSMCTYMNFYINKDKKNVMCTLN